MSKQTDNKLKLSSNIQKKQQDNFASLDQTEFWDIADPTDEAFWNEFFHIEEILDFQDELDPATFSITVQNHKTGEVRSYPHIRLLSSHQKVRC